MELLLNLAWLLLALPAWWLWRKRFTGGQRPVVSALQCLLALACALVLLFPVVSATDDLHAMRAEIEESPASKRTVRAAASERHSARLNRLQSPPSAIGNEFRLAAPETRQAELSFASFVPLPAPCAPCAGRAPPDSFLG